MLILFKKNKFMRSVSCITKSDLVKGSLPKKNNEVVVYSKDSSVVGTTKRFYFTAKNIWGMDGYYYEDMKITGCLKEETSSTKCTVAPVTLLPVASTLSCTLSP